METRANYLLVGSFVLLFSIGALVFVMWLARTSINAEVDSYDIRFSSAVTGLNVGSPVAFRGVRVGEVVDIRIDSENFDVVVRIEVQSDTPIRTDTAATLALQGLAGGTFILLKGGSETAPPLEPSEDQPHPEISSEPSNLERLFAEAPQVLAQAQEVLDRVTRLLNEENRQAIEETLANLSVLTGSLAGKSPNIEAIVDNAEAASADLRVMAKSLRENAGRLIDQADATLVAIQSTALEIGDSAAGIEEKAGVTLEEASGTLREIRAAAAEIGGAAAELEGMIAENRPAIREFTDTGLFDIVGLMAEMRNLIENLNRVTKQVERDPARFLFGDQQEGYEVPE